MNFYQNFILKIVNKVYTLFNLFLSFIVAKNPHRYPVRVGIARNGEGWHHGGVERWENRSWQSERYWETKLWVYAIKDEGNDIPLSSQSLEPPVPNGTEPFNEETEERHCISGSSPSQTSFFTTGLSFPTLWLPAPVLGCFLVLLPNSNSSKCKGHGHKCVHSYRPHLLQTIFPGLRVERGQPGGSVMWQLKQRQQRYWVPFEAALSVSCTGRPVCGDSSVAEVQFSLVRRPFLPNP